MAIKVSELDVSIVEGGVVVDVLVVFVHFVPYRGLLKVAGELEEALPILIGLLGFHVELAD